METENEKQRVNYGKRNKTKGSNAERLYAKIFREEGFDKCRTSREGSRLYDSCKIDLMFLPILVQVKAGKQRALNHASVFRDMEENLIKAFPANALEHKMPKIIIHHKEVERGKRARDEFSQLVTMSFKDFLTLLKSYTNDLQNTP